MIRSIKLTARKKVKLYNKNKNYFNEDVMIYDKYINWKKWKYGKHYP